jgi:hypothetical protein
MADTKGVGTSETTISGVGTGIPQSGWYVNIYNGPTLESDLEKAAIACGDIVNSNASTSSNQSVRLTLGGTADYSQAASGNAQMSIADGKLTVQVALSGLAPNSTHMAHIHSGSCNAQGSVVYTLNPIVANASGEGTSTTTVDQVTSIPGSGWYITVHQGATMGELLTQTGNDPIACGNAVVG